MPVLKELVSCAKTWCSTVDLGSAAPLFSLWVNSSQVRASLSLIGAERRLRDESKRCFFKYLRCIFLWEHFDNLTHQHETRVLHEVDYKVCNSVLSIYVMCVVLCVVVVGANFGVCGFSASQIAHCVRHTTPHRWAFCAFPLEYYPVIKIIFFPSNST